MDTDDGSTYSSSSYSFPVWKVGLGLVFLGGIAALIWYLVDGRHKTTKTTHHKSETSKPSGGSTVPRSVPKVIPKTFPIPPPSDTKDEETQFSETVGGKTSDYTIQEHQTKHHLSPDQGEVKLTIPSNCYKIDVTAVGGGGGGAGGAGGSGGGSASLTWTNGSTTYFSSGGGSGTSGGGGGGGSRGLLTEKTYEVKSDPTGSEIGPGFTMDCKAGAGGAGGAGGTGGTGGTLYRILRSDLEAAAHGGNGANGGNGDDGIESTVFFKNTSNKQIDSIRSNGGSKGIGGQGSRGGRAAVAHDNFITGGEAGAGASGGNGGSLNTIGEAQGGQASRSGTGGSAGSRFKRVSDTYRIEKPGIGGNISLIISHPGNKNNYVENMGTRGQGGPLVISHFPYVAPVAKASLKPCLGGKGSVQKDVRGGKGGDGGKGGLGGDGGLYIGDAVPESTFQRGEFVERAPSGKNGTNGEDGGDGEILITFYTRTAVEKT